MLKPAAKSGLWTQVRFKAAQGLGNALGLEPRDDDDRLAALASAISATRATIGLPPIASSSLLRGDMRAERPAARTIAATFIIGSLAARDGRDFGDDRERDLGRPLRADIEPDRRVNAADGVARDARFDQALTRAACVTLLPSAPT